jgi:hypothetical protein
VQLVGGVELPVVAAARDQRQEPIASQRRPAGGHRRERRPVVLDRRRRRHAQAEPLIIDVDDRPVVSLPLRELLQHARERRLVDRRPDEGRAGLRGLPHPESSNSTAGGDGAGVGVGVTGAGAGDTGTGVGVAGVLSVVSVGVVVVVVVVSTGSGGGAAGALRRASAGTAAAFPIVGLPVAGALTSSACALTPTAGAGLAALPALLTA